MSVSERRRRLSAEQTREAMLRTAAARVRDDGLALDLADISLEAIIRSAGVARSTVFRIWPDRSAFVADLVRRLFDENTAAPTGFDEETLHIVERVVVTHSAQMATTEGRADVLRAAAREAVGHNFAVVAASAPWNTYRMLLSVANGGDSSFSGGEVRDLLKEIELRFLDRMTSVYATLNDMFQREMLPGVSERDLGAAVVSVIEGLVDRAALLPDQFDSPRELMTDGGAHEEWHLAALAVHALYVSLTRPTAAVR